MPQAASGRPRAQQHVLGRLALHGEVGVVGAARRRIGEPAPDQDAVDRRPVEHGEPVGQHFGLQQRIGGAVRSSALSHGLAAAPSAERNPISATMTGLPMRFDSASSRSVDRRITASRPILSSSAPSGG